MLVVINYYEIKFELIIIIIPTYLKHKMNINENNRALIAQNASGTINSTDFFSILRAIVKIIPHY